MDGQVRNRTESPATRTCRNVPLEHPRKNTAGNQISEPERNPNPTSKVETIRRLRLLAHVVPELQKKKEEAEVVGFVQRVALGRLQRRLGNCYPRVRQNAHGLSECVNALLDQAQQIRRAGLVE